MGYDTNYAGTMFFVEELTGKQIAFLDKILGEDCRDHNDWQPEAGDMTHIDLEMDEDYAGLVWNGSEKSYDMGDKLNLIVKLMRRQWPSFGFAGKMQARDDETDYNIISKDDGFVEVVPLTLITGRCIHCPECGHEFNVD